MAKPLEEVQKELPQSTVKLQVVPETTQYVTGAQNALELAEAFTVDSPEMLEAASNEVKRVKQRLKELDDKRKELTKPLDVAKKQWIEFFRPALDALSKAEQVYKTGINKYLEEEDRKRREAEAAAAEKARKEQERLQKRAEKAAEQGKAEKAEELEHQAATVQTAVVRVQTHKVAGVSRRANWSAEIIDKMALIKAVAAGEIQDVYLDVNIKLLNQQAKSLKDHLNIPGVKAVKDTGIAIRS